MTMNRKTVLSAASLMIAMTLIGAGCMGSAPQAPAPTPVAPSPAVPTDQGAGNPAATTGTGSPAVAASEQAVMISGFAFSPQSITVAKGTNVTWTNNDTVTHTVTGDTGADPGSSGNIAVGGTYAYVFNTPGTYTYHCSIHPSMTGTITVTP
jgi:plastocyanin